jgi:hypothetical protein
LTDDDTMVITDPAVVITDAWKKGPFRRTIVALATFAALALSADAYAAEIGIEIGPVTAETIATRGYAAWNATRWLALEAGVLVVPNGTIVDVTPMFHTPGTFFVGAGIGFGYNFVDNTIQSEGAIFHDVLGLGYKMTERCSLLVHVQHWSNGGHDNPTFGTTANGGYTAVTFGITYRF